MMHTDIFRIIETGSIFFPDCTCDVDEKPWYSPPGWDGVFLKDVITRKETNGKFSYHLVRIQEHCEVPDHDHEIQWEWNVILSGTGSFRLGGKDIPVKTGQTFATPPGTHHTVLAGNKELFLLAMFVPALG